VRCWWKHAVFHGVWRSCKSTHALKLGLDCQDIAITLTKPEAHGLISTGIILIPD
jgi:hypothetical protein